MSLNNIKNQGASIGTSVFPKSQKTTKRVEDIILNENHPAYTGPDSIGIIFFADEKTKEDTLDPTTLPRAKPQNLNNWTVPCIGDLVHIQSSINSNYYPDLGGNPNFTSNYYTNTINVHNNAGSNAVPLNKRTKRKNKKDKTRESEPNFEFTKEFRASSQQVASINCNNYLRDLGYPSGRNDRNSPKYILSQAFNGDYILRLDDSKENKVKLGLYYKENPNQQNLNPSEGSTLFQGKDGQRIHYISTGPNGVNSVSRNVTDVDDDGNPNIGDSAMILSLGKGSTENITDDAASIYLGENLNLPNLLTVLASTNIDSTKSEYKPLEDPLEQPTKPLIDWSKINVLDTAEIVYDPDEEDNIDNPDPLFDVLDEVQEEGLLEDNDIEHPEISGIEEDVTVFGDYGNEVSTTSNLDEFPEDLTEKELQELYEDKPDSLYAQRNRAAVKEFKRGAEVYFSTCAGRLFPVKPYKLPSEINISSTNSGNRTIEYLVLHTTGGATSRTAADEVNYLFNPDDPTKTGSYGRLFLRPGYHYMVNNEGKVSNTCPLDVSPWGASGYNNNGIHINWIGGADGKAIGGQFNMSKQQIFTFKVLMEKHIGAYPNIKVIGHNQVKNKPCPNFYAPTFARELGIPNKNISEIRSNSWYTKESKLEGHKIASRNLAGLIPHL